VELFHWKLKNNIFNKHLENFKLLDTVSNNTRWSLLIHLKVNEFWEMSVSDQNLHLKLEYCTSKLFNMNLSLKQNRSRAPFQEPSLFIISYSTTIIKEKEEKQEWSFQVQIQEKFFCFIRRRGKLKLVGTLREWKCGDLSYYRYKSLVV